MNRIISYLTLILLFTQCLSIEVKNLGDSNLDTEVGTGKGSNWLLMFYLETCPHCKNAKEVFMSISSRKELEGPEALIENLQIAQIECSSNNWACMRFNVTRVPTIMVLQNDMMFEYDTYVTEDKLLKFITEDKLISTGEDIPSMLTWYSILINIYKEIVVLLNEQIRDILQDKLGLNIEWNNYYTIFLLVNFLVLIILVEYAIVKYCCSTKKKPKTEVIGAQPAGPVTTSEPAKTGDKDKTD